MPSALEASSRQRSDFTPTLIRLDVELPPDVSSAAFALDGFASTKRRAEQLLGRHAAAVALGELGLPTCVGRSPTGLPVWPAGGVGSISHGGGLAWALCARQQDYRAVGVDVERLLHDAEARELAPAIAHQDELLLLRAALPHVRSGQRLSALFSAKESFLQCLYSLTGSFLEFSEARLVSVGMSSRRRGALLIRLERDCGPSLPSGRTFQARFALGARRVESAVLLRTG